MGLSRKLEQSTVVELLDVSLPAVADGAAPDGVGFTVAGVDGATADVGLC